MQVNPEKCIGCGACAGVSDIFVMKDGKSTLAEIPATPDEKKKFEEKFKLGQSVCPVGAIED